MTVDLEFAQRPSAWPASRGAVLRMAASTGTCPTRRAYPSRSSARL